MDEEKLRVHGTYLVTTRDIDQQVRDLAKVIGYGINWALQDLEIGEINAPAELRKGLPAGTQGRQSAARGIRL